jgi:integrase
MMVADAGAAARATAPSPEPPWSWPLDATGYDRTPELRPNGAAALAPLVARFDRNLPWPAILDPVLDRLFRPVDDVLSITGATGQLRTAVLRLVARELHRQQRSVWAWTAAEWVETLGTTEPAFRRRHGGRPENRQQVLALAYLLGDFHDWAAVGIRHRVLLARKVFGAQRVDAAIHQVVAELERLGYRATVTERVQVALADAMLARRSPRLVELDADLLDAWRTRWRARYPGQTSGWFVLGHALFTLGFLDRPLAPATAPASGGGEATDAVAPEWVWWCQRWRDTSPLPPTTRATYYRLLLKAGRWVTSRHPEAVTPERWTREVAVAYVAAVDRMTIGEWTRTGRHPFGQVPTGTPLSAWTKEGYLTVLRTFVRDCQEWGWIPRRFDPGRCLRTPRALYALMAPNPRVIADEIWAKLLWAGLNLTEADLVAPGAGMRGAYPLAMMRALAVVWLFAGLRRSEIRRLRVGCVRWQSRDGAPTAGAGDRRPAGVCLLDVPPTKAEPAFTKPVDGVVGETVAAWEGVRPDQPTLLDLKTGEWVHYLFAYRGRRIGEQLLNASLIPILCHKAGVPEHDARGAITTHRARATIATQLFNAKEPLSLFELQAWLGHRSPHATQYYAKILPTRLAKAYAAAGYFARNVRTITVLIDQGAIRHGVAPDQPWKMYDLGHGYCTYDFFDQCPHRMACAKCAFYLPKGSSRAQALEGKTHLLRMLQEIPLTEDERAAVEDGVTAFDRLLDRLSQVPTPTGPTPRQLKHGGAVAAPVLKESGGAGTGNAPAGGMGQPPGAPANRRSVSPGADELRGDTRRKPGRKRDG